MIPYSRQSIDEDDIRAVVEVLRSEWVTTGPKVEAFEGAVAEFVGSRHAVAVSSGTAGLHAAMHAAGIGPGDEVIVPAITFAATANAVVFQGGIPVFADVDPETLLIDPRDAEQKITSRTKAIVAVDYAGQPCDYNALRVCAARHSLTLVADGCHALGAEYRGTKVGTLADLTVFSFHPVKHICTGEGGMVVTDDSTAAAQLRRFRNHGISTDFQQRSELGTWYYEMVELGYNYRLTDLQCALGISQLRKLPPWLLRRREIARRYDESFSGRAGILPLTVRPEVQHSYHLYVIRIDPVHTGADRGRVFRALRAKGIGVNVHYVPVHLHPFYRDRFGYKPGLCPVAEDAYAHILSLPIFPAMTGEDQEVVTYSLTHLEEVLAETGPA